MRKKIKEPGFIRGQAEGKDTRPRTNADNPRKLGSGDKTELSGISGQLEKENWGQVSTLDTFNHEGHEESRRKNNAGSKMHVTGDRQKNDARCKIQDTKSIEHWAWSKEIRY